jgi:hypothetical protein
MKKIQIFLLLLSGILVNLSVTAQEIDGSFHPTGKPIIQVFGNFDYNAADNVQKQFGFWFGRAHFGYEYLFSPQFSGKIIIDAGRPTTVGQISVVNASGDNLSVTNASKEGSYYTMTLKFALLEWKLNEQFKIQAGGILQNHYITQEKFWGYRYIAPTFQDKYYGIPSSDLGFIAYYKANKKIGFDLALTNGEGFRFDQDAYGDVKLAGGIDFIPVKNLQTRFYYDHTSSKNPSKLATQQLISFFAGYKFQDKFRVGGEYNYRINHQNISNHNLFGWSFYGSYALKKNIELFARYDLLQTNTLSGQNSSWYAQNTGSAVITGVHFSPVKGINLSLNYQGWILEEKENERQHHILFSFEYKL